MLLRSVVQQRPQAATVPVSVCPLSLRKSGSNGVLFVMPCVFFGSWCVRSCVFVLISGPGSGFRPVN
eukprot:124610-Amphidinium_carterae.1